MKRIKPTFFEETYVFYRNMKMWSVVTVCADKELTELKGSSIFIEYKTGNPTFLVSHRLQRATYRVT
jgi:hypothetical protein